jgi:peptide deformylase
LIKDIKRICKAKDGVGIASPQVGVNKSIFILWSKPNKRYPKAPDMPKPLVIINPKVLEVSKQMISDWEGCLSIPGIRAKVSRHKSLRVEFQNEEGEVVKESFSGFVARIFQHEFDHLEGVLFIDRVKSTELFAEDEFREIIKTKNRL